MGANMYREMSSHINKVTIISKQKYKENRSCKGENLKNEEKENTGYP